MDNIDDSERGLACSGGWKALLHLASLLVLFFVATHVFAVFNSAELLLAVVVIGIVGYALTTALFWCGFSTHHPLLHLFLWVGFILSVYLLAMNQLTLGFLVSKLSSSIQLFSLAYASLVVTACAYQCRRTEEPRGATLALCLVMFLAHYLVPAAVNDRYQGLSSEITIIGTIESVHRTGPGCLPDEGYIVFTDRFGTWQYPNTYLWGCGIPFSPQMPVAVHYRQGFLGFPILVHVSEGKSTSQASTPQDDVALTTTHNPE